MTSEPSPRGPRLVGVVVAVLGTLLLVTGVVVLVTGDEEEISAPAATPAAPSDEPTAAPTSATPWVDTVDAFVVAFYGRDCDTLLRLSPSTWSDQETCLRDIKDGIDLLGSTVGTTTLDDEQDPSEAAVELSYEVLQVSTGQNQTYETTFTVVEDDDGAWVVTDFELR